MSATGKNQLLKKYSSTNVYIYTYIFITYTHLLKKPQSRRIALFDWIELPKNCQPFSANYVEPYTCFQHSSDDPSTTLASSPHCFPEGKVFNQNSVPQTRFLLPEANFHYPQLFFNPPVNLINWVKLPIYWRVYTISFGTNLPVPN